MFDFNKYNDRWKGETIWIACSGPSLNEWNPRDFRHCFMLWVNSSVHYWMRKRDCNPPPWHFRVIFDAEVLYQDMKHPYHSEVKTFISKQAHSTFATHCKDDKWLYRIWNGPYCTFRFTRMFPGATIQVVRGELWKPTTFSAINLALNMGAAEINIVGMDHGKVDRAYYWNGSDPGVDEQNFHDDRILLSKRIGPYCAARGVTVRRFVKPGIEIPLGRATYVS